MIKTLLLASLLIASNAISTGANAQNVYKCSGNTYSQIPCPDGVKMPPPDTPDRAQRVQADQATARDALTADRMEKERLKQEQIDLKNNTPTPVTVGRTASVQASKPVKHKDFVAKAPGTKKPPPKKRKPPTD